MSAPLIPACEASHAVVPDSVDLGCEPVDARRLIVDEHECREMVSQRE